MKLSQVLGLGILVIGLVSGCTKKEEPVAVQATTETTTTTTVTVAAKLCDDHALCAGFRESEVKCREGKKKDDCEKFVSLYKQLAVKKDCQRQFDKAPVPSVWLCDEDSEEKTYPKIFERSATTLSNLKYPFAQQFYASEAFRSVLDGAVAEEHFKESLKLEKKFKK